jgi:putative ABC transport system permease protein
MRAAGAARDARRSDQRVEVRVIDTLLQDVRLALRRLAKAPGFSAVALLTLALGVGANASIFSVVDAVVFRPLPFPEPERLSFITREGDVSILDGIDWRAHSRSFQEISLFLRSWSFDLTGVGEPERLNGSVVEPDYFRVLPMKPLVGRVLTAADNQPGAPAAAVLSEAFWRRRFAADPAIVGREIALSDVKTTVVGVMPAAFDFLHDQIDLWTPVASATPMFLNERGSNNFDALGRLRAGHSLDGARQEMMLISRRLEREYPRTNRNKIVDPLPLLDFMVGGVRRGMYVLLAAVGLVMLIACVNLASLLLARSAARQDEMAVRLAIGAGRGRLLRQWLTEGTVLALLGGLAGVGAAWLARDLLVAAAPATFPRASEAVVDGRVLAFGLALALVTGVAMSLLPALQTLRGDLASHLKGAGKGTAGGGQKRWLAGLVTTEVALAFLLLVGAGLLLRTFARIQSVPLGFQTERVLLADMVLPESRYGRKPLQDAAFLGILDRLRQLPGVDTAAYVTTPPLSPRGGLGSRFLIDGREFERNREPGARARFVHGDYFKALGLKVSAGRAFTRADHEGGERVAIVNRRFAREQFPNGALGQRISFRDWNPNREIRWMTIVGVVEDIKGAFLRAPDSPTVFVPFVQRPQDWVRFGTLVVRTQAEPGSVLPELRQAVWSVDPTLPLANIQEAAALVRGAAAQERFNAFALASFSTVALLLALQGLYGILAFLVEQRRREIGVRMALGATGGDVLRLVVGRGVVLVALGLGVGLMLALSSRKLLASLLFETSATDALTYAATGLALLVTALVACLLPARRAARVDPIAALRYE